MRWYRGIEQSHPREDAQAFPEGGFALWRVAFLQNLKNLLYVGILFLLTAAPILTLPAAYKALSEVCVMMLRDRAMPSVTRAYFGAFRREFWQSTVVGFAVMLGLVGISRLATLGETIVLQIIALVLASMLMLWFWSYVTLLVSVALPSTARVKNALLLVPLRIGTLLLMLAFTAILLFLGVQLFLVPGAFILLLCPAPLVFTINHICYGALREYVLPKETI